LLRAYVSKLGSLSWRLTSFGVAGQNGADHFVHEMTHLAHSDVVLAVGRPDGRLAGLTALESSIIMSVQQARFISGSASGGVEAISVSHNPWVKPGLFARHILLPTRQRPPFQSQVMLRTDGEGHSPGAVMHRVATMAGEADLNSLSAGMAETDVISIDLPELIKRLGGRNHIPRECGVAIVQSLIHEQQERLRIDANKFDVQRLFEMSGIKNRHHEDNDAHPGECLSFAGKAWTTRALSTLRYSASMKSSSQTLQISISIIMSILRGSNMRFMVQELRRAEMRADIIMRRAQHWLGGVSVGVVKEVFHAWLQFLEQRRAEKAEEARKAALEASRAPAQVHIEGHENEPTQSAKLMRWRKHEELRRNAKHRVKIFGISVSICFTYWKRHARERGAAVGRPRPLPRQSKTVGSNLVSAGTGERILAEFTLLETLYESRIGSDERLLAFL